MPLNNHFFMICPNCLKMIKSNYCPHCDTIFEQCVSCGEWFEEGMLSIDDFCEDCEDELCCRMCGSYETSLDSEGLCEDCRDDDF